MDSWPHTHDRVLWQQEHVTEAVFPFLADKRQRQVWIQRGVRVSYNS